MDTVCFCGWLIVLWLWIEFALGGYLVVFGCYWVVLYIAGFVFGLIC